MARVKTLVLGVVLSALALPASAQRLPANVEPIHYDLTVEPDLAAATFTGREAITVRLHAPARTIVLNAAEIEFGSVRSSREGARRSQS